MRRFLALALILAPLTAQAQVCAPVPDHEAEKDALYQALRLAEDEPAARAISAELWRIWIDAPDDQAQAMLDRGIALIGLGNFAGAISALDGLVAYCPDWAEGWNQRAYAAFLARDGERALSDLDAALARDPRHVGALAGRALTLLGLGREAEGQEALRRALRLNPWLAERQLLTLPPEETL